MTRSPPPRHSKASALGVAVASAAGDGQLMRAESLRVPLIGQGRLLLRLVVVTRSRGSAVGLPGASRSDNVALTIHQLQAPPGHSVYAPLPLRSSTILCRSAVAIATGHALCNASTVSGTVGVHRAACPFAGCQPLYTNPAAR